MAKEVGTAYLLFVWLLGGVGAWIAGSAFGLPLLTAAGVVALGTFYWWMVKHG